MTGHFRANIWRLGSGHTLWYPYHHNHHISLALNILHHSQCIRLHCNHSPQHLTPFPAYPVAFIIIEQHLSSGLDLCNEEYLAASPLLFPCGPRFLWLESSLVSPRSWLRDLLMKTISKLSAASSSGRSIRRLIPAPMASDMARLLEIASFRWWNESSWMVTRSLRHRVHTSHQLAGWFKHSHLLRAVPGTPEAIARH